MKTWAKSFVLIALFIISAMSVFAEPAKTVNKDAVLKAIVGYDQKIGTDPKSEDAYINRAYLNYIIGNIQAAIEDYDILISINPKNEEFFLNRGYLKHISNKREEALKDYEAALQVNPRYAFAHNNRGVVLSELGRSEESLTAYNTAIKIDPNYADAYYNRGNLKTRTEKNEEALEDFNNAIKLNPSDSASYNNRGVVKRKLNYDVGALSDFSIAIRLNPEDITAFANRGRLKKRYFDSEGAEEDFKTAVAVANESPVLIKEIEIQKQLADSKKTTPTAPVQELSQPKVAQEPIQKIANKQIIQPELKKEEPVKVASAMQAGVLKVDPGHTKSTITQTAPVKPAPEITTKPVANPKLAECYYIRALQKYILQNRESALSDFNMAIQYNPEYAEAYYYRAAIKRDLKDDGFVDDYTKAIKINPSLKAVNDADVLMILKI